MPNVLGVIRTNSAYAFLLIGVVWLGIAVIAASPLILWPVVACLLGGVMLRMWPANRLTWAWAVSAAVLGFLLSAYQVYAWVPFLGGHFSALAEGALAGFAVLAVAHVFLMYAGASRPKAPKSGPS